MAALTLYDSPGSPCARRVRLTRPTLGDALAVARRPTSNPFDLEWEQALHSHRRGVRLDHLPNVGRWLNALRTRAAVRADDATVTGQTDAHTPW